MTLKRVTDPKEIERVNRDYEEFRKKEIEHCKPLFDYMIANCSIQRIGYNCSNTGKKISVKKVLEEADKRVKGIIKEPLLLDEIFQENPPFDVGYTPGIIQICDDAGEISSVLNSYRRLKKMLEFSHTLTQVYERGFISDEHDAPAHYWDYPTHFNFDIKKLDTQEEFEKVSFLESMLSPFDRAFTLATFTNYLDILGYPNGHDNWDNEQIFRGNYLCGNDSRWLVGTNSQLDRYRDFDSRYKIKGLGEVENTLRREETTQFRRLEEIVGTIQSHN